MAQQPPIPPDPNTPRQRFYGVAKAITVRGTLESADIWGQVPEPGDPIAPLQYAEVDHRTWKEATLEPIALLPHDVVQNYRRHVRGGRAR